YAGRGPGARDELREQLAAGPRARVAGVVDQRAVDRPAAGREPVSDGVRAVREEVVAGDHGGAGVELSVRIVDVRLEQRRDLAWRLDEPPEGEAGDEQAVAVADVGRARVGVAVVGQGVPGGLRGGDRVGRAAERGGIVGLVGDPG